MLKGFFRIELTQPGLGMSSFLLITGGGVESVQS